MFQSFKTLTNPKDGPPRLARLRETLAADGLEGFLVPRADRFQGEYVAPHDDRLAWLTGFTGSAGFAAVLEQTCGVFVDGRYRVQIKAQTDPEHFTPVPWPDVQLGDWLLEQAPNGATIGFDMWLHTVDEIEKLTRSFANSPLSLTPVNRNPIDHIWDDQPAPPTGKAFIHPIEFAGETSLDKRTRLASDLQKQGEAQAILTLPDSICWLLNLRGSDVAHNPVLHGFAILYADGAVDLFVETEKLADVTEAMDDGITIKPPDSFTETLAALKGTTRIDPKTAPFAVKSILNANGVATTLAPDPCVLPKARKNAIEIKGMAETHLRDGAAMCEFLCWLDATAPSGELTEIAVAQQLETFRRADNALHDISFETISATGPNAALPHYRVHEGIDTPITPGQMFLIDSGGQYLDGTTDITRTVAIGEVPKEQKACYTRVLQGMIAMSRLRWPRGLAGRDIDAVARYPLWLAGQDYNHGTGHGVGAFLSVHEGPARLSRVSEVPLEPGMILSDEPGYYREGQFGVRIENLLVVEDAPPFPGGDADRQMLHFQTLTFVPIDTRLIVPTMLTAAERDWLNTYHAGVQEKLQSRVTAPTLEWLRQATRPI